MHRAGLAVVVVAVAACNRGSPPKDRPGEAASGSGSSSSSSGSAGETAGAEPAPAPGTCERLPFEDSTPVPEASGAAWLTLDGRPALLVISDSGNDGAYTIVDAESGETREQGKLPLGDGGGEDLEGVAVRGGTFYAISSPGWIRAWKRAERGFTLVDGPYPLGPVDLDNGDGNRPPAGDGMVCAQQRTNCGRNYEGLCLVAEPAGGARCAGFAAAKADGQLYCVVERDGRLALDRDVPRIAVARPGALADCAFSDDGALLAGSNLFDLSNVYRIEGWQAPATARAVAIGPLGVGFPETIAARGDVVYRMSDTGKAPSLMARFRCAR